MTTSPEPCPACEKPTCLCVCDAIAPVDTGLGLLILRHPQEQDVRLGTAKIAALQIAGAVLKTGLSWRNLGHALGREADAKRWGVLYLGTAKTPALPDRTLTALTKKGEIAPDQDTRLAALEGLILLDGSWAQAKALWWRNAWLLKCQRLILQPPHPSLYGALRPEPRKESVSTIEAAAYAMAALKNDPSLAEKILPPFRTLLDRARKAGK